MAPSALRGPAAAVAAALVALSCASARADTPTGRWQFAGGSATLQFTTCAGALCATLVDSKRLQAEPGARDEKNHNAALRTRPLRGIVFLWGLKGGPGHWTGGHVYSPGNGDTYAVTLDAVDADTLALKGCLAPGLCKSLPLKRVR